MMKFKKFLAAAMTGLMMFGAVATAAPAITTYAEDEETVTKSTYEITVDYTTFTATISKADKEDAYIILEVLKENKEDSKVSATYTYPVVALDSKFGAVVDLSFLKVKNNSYIRVRGNSEEKPTDVKTISAQQPKFSMKYTSGKKTLAEALLIDKAAAKAEDLEKYEYRTLYGSHFKALNLLDQDPESDTDDLFKALEIAGTTIIVRKAALEDTAADADAGTAAVVGAPASPEVKVKIAAAPKAPKVTIDYAKGTIKLPKNVQLQLISEADDGTVTVTNWIDCSETAVDQAKILGLFYKVGDDGIADADALAAKIAEITASGFTVAVRVKETEKKAASNPTILTVKAVETLEQSKDEDNNPIDEVKVGNASLKWKATKTGIEYTVTGAPFEYKDGEKWKTLKVGTVTVKGAVTADKEVEVRAAGVKTAKEKEGTFPSSVVKITVKKYTAPVGTIEVKVTPAEVTKPTGSTPVTAACTAVVKDTDGNDVTKDTEITWSISGSGVTIDETTGEVSVPKTATAGEYTITATCGDKTGTAKLTVK